MACGSCGSTSCRGCKDIKIVLPSAKGIQSAVDNTGSVTITYTDGSTFTFNTGTPTNDSWVEFDETTVAAVPNWTGTATLNGSVLLDGAYKVLNEDTIFIRTQARINATITAIDNSINFNFRLGTISSNWYAGTKLPSMVINSSTIQGWVPISIVSTTSGARPNTIGRAYAAETPAPDGLIAIGNTNLQLANGTYNFIIDWEMTCKLV